MDSASVDQTDRHHSNQEMTDETDGTEHNAIGTGNQRLCFNGTAQQR
jgi:hypothetical protein